MCFLRDERPKKTDSPKMLTFFFGIIFDMNFLSNLIQNKIEWNHVLRDFILKMIQKKK